MVDDIEKVKVAAVQAAPVFLDREATVGKACVLVEEAADEGAGLVVFPEAFVPGYPEWVWRMMPWEVRAEALYARLFDQSVVVGDEATAALSAAARRAKIYLSIGVNEREVRGSTLFDTQLCFGPDGTLVSMHRKLVPTGAERLVWGMGDGSSLVVAETPFGRLGGLISWENYMPLARTALYQQGIDVYLAPTWDNSDVWLSTLRHIAKEGRVYVVGASLWAQASDVPVDVPFREELYAGEELLSGGVSVIIDPLGEVLAGPVEGKEGVVYADLDVQAARTSRHQFDPTGHFARPDILRLAAGPWSRNSG
jgi:nitrilase